VTQLSNQQAYILMKLVKKRMRSQSQCRQKWCDMDDIAAEKCYEKQAVEAAGHVIITR